MYIWMGLIDLETPIPNAATFSRIFLKSRGVFTALFCNPYIGFYRMAHKLISFLTLKVLEN